MVSVLGWEVVAGFLEACIRLHWVNPPEAGEPLTNAHCAVKDSTVRVTAANLLFGHHCIHAIILPHEEALLDPGDCT
ncbi:unnamed protein product [Caretta caretta]